jgi:dihydrofolate reductase
LPAPGERNGRSGRQPDRSGVEHATQVRGIDHTHRTRWANTTVLSTEVAAAVGELKAKPGRELQVHGSRTLIRWLLDNDLVDKLNLFIFPVVVGDGTRLFPDTGPDMALELVESRATPAG